MMFQPAEVIIHSRDYNAFPKIIRLVDGRYWLVFYRGNAHIDKKNRGSLWQMFSSDRGDKWTEPSLLAFHPRLDVRNPALGQLIDGTLVLAYATLDRKVYHSHRCSWIYSNDEGVTWSDPREITNEEFSTPLDFKEAWFTPYGNLFNRGPENLWAFYGVGPMEGRDTVSDSVLLMQLDLQANRWKLKSIAAESYKVPPDDFTTGHGESAIVPAGNEWLCLSRTRLSNRHLYLSISGDNCGTWSVPVDTGIVGQSPELVPLGKEGSEYLYFCAYRGDNEKALLKGGLAKYDPLARSFKCEDEVLHAAIGRGKGDFAYPSGFRLDDGSVFFVHYEVRKRWNGWEGRILKQIWKKK